MTRRAQKPDKLYRTRATLRIHSTWQVIDTLRYETMVPDTQQDAEALERLVGGWHEATNITFRRYSMNPGGPNEERLQSYGIVLISWEPV